MEQKRGRRPWRYLLLVALLSAVLPLAVGGAVSRAATSASVSPSNYLVISPSTVSQGQAFSIASGCGFQPGATATAWVTDVSGNYLTTISTTLSVSASGCLTTAGTLVVPSTLSSGTTYLLRVQDSSGNTEYGLLPVNVASLTVSPSSVTYTGNSVAVTVSSVSGFPSSSSLSFALRPAINPGAPVTGSLITSSPVYGGFTYTYSIPGAATPGAYFLTAQGGGVTEAALVQVGGSGPGTAGTLQLSSGSLSTGQAETGTLCTTTGGLTLATLTMTSVSTGATVYGPYTVTLAPTATSGVCYSFSFVVPSLQSGSYNVNVNSAAGTATAALMVNTATTAAGALTLSPSSALPGQLVVASGCGFSANETVSVVIFNSQGVVLGIVATGPAPIGTSGTTGPVCETASFTVPPLPNGAYQVKMTGSSSNVTDSATLSIGTSAAAVTASPTYGPVGTTITLSGSGFTPSVAVSITGLGPSLTTTTSSGGVFATTLTIPAGTAAGAYTLTALDAAGLHATVTVVVTTGGAALQVSMTSGQPGQVVTVTGSGFLPNEQVVLALSSTAVSPSALAGTAQTVMAGASGTISASYTVPTLTPGSYYVLAQGQTSHALAIVPFSITSVTAQPTATPGTVPLPPIPTAPPKVVATLPTISSAATTRYFAEGYTGTAAVNGKVTFNEQMVLFNDGPSSSVVTITYDVINPSNSAHTSVTETNTVTPGATVVRNVNQDVGNDRYVSATVSATAGIVAEEVISRVSSTGATLDSASSMGTATPGTTWYLAEGYTGESLQEYLTVYNPNATVADARIQYLPASGGTLPPVQLLTIQPHTRATINVRSQYNTLVPKGTRNIGAMVTANTPVVVDRAMYWGAGSGSAKYGFSLAPAASTPATAQYFALLPNANGSQSFVTVLNPSTTTTQLTLRLLNNQGLAVKTVTASVGSMQRYTFVLPLILGTYAGNVSAALVTSTQPVVAEAPVYIGGSPNIGAHPGTIEAGLPARGIGSQAFVDPAGGLLRVFNPGTAPARVQVALYTSTGRSVLYDATIAVSGSSDVTVPGGSGSRSVVVLASSPVISALLNGYPGSAQITGGTLQQ